MYPLELLCCSSVYLLNVTSRSTTLLQIIASKVDFLTLSCMTMTTLLPSRRHSSKWIVVIAFPGTFGPVDIIHTSIELNMTRSFLSNKLNHWRTIPADNHSMCDTWKYIHPGVTDISLFGTAPRQALTWSNLALENAQHLFARKTIRNVRPVKLN